MPHTRTNEQPGPILPIIRSGLKLAFGCEGACTEWLAAEGWQATVSKRCKMQQRRCTAEVALGQRQRT